MITSCGPNVHLTFTLNSPKCLGFVAYGPNVYGPNVHNLHVLQLWLTPNDNLSVIIVMQYTDTFQLKILCCFLAGCFVGISD